MSGYKFGSGGPSWNGIPMINGIPVTFGNSANKGAGTVYYVNPTTGGDGNKGTSMDRPLATLAAAYAKTVSNNHDVVVLSATAAHAQTDEVTVTKNRCHFWGMDAVGRYLGQRTRVTMGTTTGTAIAIFQNTGVGNTWSNMKFDSSDALSTSKYAFADGGEYTVIENCEITATGQAGVATAGRLLCNGDSSLYRNCYIGSSVGTSSLTTTNTNVLFTGATITGKYARDVMFEDCIFALYATNNNASQMYISAANDINRFLIIKNCIFYHAVLASATVAAAIRVGAAQTDGYVLVKDSAQFNHTALATATSNVFYQGAEIATNSTAGDAIEVA